MGISLKEACAGTNLLASKAQENAQSLDGKTLMRGNINEEISNFTGYYNRIVESANKVVSSAVVKVDDFEIVDNEDELSKTSFFSNTFIASADEVFGDAKTPEVEVAKEIKEDNVSDNSFIISREELHALNNRMNEPVEPVNEPVKETFSEPVVEAPEVRPVDSFTEALTPITSEEEENEVISFEAEQEKAKVKTLGKKAAYVDTVILCLIAQLSIFGLLIIVLLIIK